MKRWIYILVPAVALFSLIGWRFFQNKKDKAQQNQAAAARKNAPPNVRLAPAIVRDIRHVFQGVGDVEAPFSVRISPKVTGLLTYLPYREGAHVTPGEVLARIDPATIEATVRQQQAAVAEAKFRLTQAVLTTNPTNVNVTSQIRQQQAGLYSSQANAKQTQQNYAEQVGAAHEAVTDAQGRVDAANAAIANMKAAIDSAQSNVNNAKVRYDRTNDLYKQGFTAAQDVDDARTTMEVQQSALRVAQAQLSAANSARDSALAQLRAAQDQEKIVRTKGISDIAAANAAVRQSQAGLEYARSNTAQKPAYQANLAALRATVASEEGLLKNAQAQLSDTVLRSSVDGWVTSRNADPGTVVTAGQAVLVVDAIRQVFVSTSVPEDVTRHIYVGQSTQVNLDALPGQTFTAKVVQVNPAADTQSRSFVIRAILDNPRNMVKPGMYARVNIVTQTTPNAVVVPREAVRPSPNGQVVYVVDSNLVAHQRVVQTGDSDPIGIQILQGVQAGDNVAIISAQPIKDGQKVRVDKGAVAAPAGGQPVIEGGGGASPSGAATSTGGANAPTYGGQTTVTTPNSGTTPQGSATPGPLGSTPNATNGMGTTTPGQSPATATPGAAQGGASAPGANPSGGAASVPSAPAAGSTPLFPSTGSSTGAGSATGRSGSAGGAGAGSSGSGGASGSR